jgi:trimeric autotransporter adhesin
MKTQFLKTTIMLIALATGSIISANAQTTNTTASGVSLSNNANPVAGSAGVNYTFYGSGAGNANAAGGVHNTFIGYNAGLSNTTSDSCSVLGAGALASCTTGGHNNTAIGCEALHNNLGARNVAVGNYALFSQSYNSDGFNSYNVAVGYQALYSNNPSASSNGIKNTAIGDDALRNNVTGIQNTALGWYAGYRNTASYNIFLGANSGASNSSGSYNTIAGIGGGGYNATGSYNTIMGYQAGLGAAGNSNSGNSLFGYQAGNSLTTGGYNVFTGYQAGYNSTTATYNVFIGREAGYTNSTGGANIFIGYHAGYSNTASNNTFVGYTCGGENTSGNYNTFSGYWSGHDNTTGANNTFYGAHSGYNTTDGTNNAYIGKSAGYNNSTGDYNTSLGVNAGDSYADENNCTFIGYGADANANSYSNAAAVGNGVIVDASNKAVFGNVNVTWTGTLSTSDWQHSSDGRFKFNIEENVKGLEFINKLRPVTYQMNTEALDDFVIKNMPDSVKALHKAGMDYALSTAIVHSGFIAQEVEQAEIDCGYNSSIVTVPGDTSTGTYSMAYAEIVVPLVKAVQEQQAIIDSLRMAISALTEGSNKSLIIPNHNEGEESIKYSQEIKLLLPDAATLGDAQPNPNDGNTQIPYYVPENINDAKIIFTDLLGKVMQEKPLQVGYGVLDIDTHDLPAGIYSYSIVIDGKVLDNKKMIRNK